LRRNDQFFKIKNFQPNAVTLENIFKMNLLQYADVIAEITNIATKETLIEKVLQEFSDTWNKMRFTVSPYRFDQFILPKTSKCRIRFGSFKSI
jgi:hypothetical protein